MPLYRGGARIVKLYRGATPIARAYRGNSLVVGSDVALPLDGLSNVTGAWSMARPMLTAWSGALFTDASGAVSQLNDQSGNSRNLTQGTSGARPAITTAGPKSRTCARFDGTNDTLAGAALSNFITASAGYVIACVIPRVLDKNNTAAYHNDAIWSDQGNSFAGFFFRNASGTYSWQAYNYDGSVDATSATMAMIDQVLVCEWRHESGTLYGRVNGGGWESVASGNTADLTAAFRLAVYWNVSALGFTEIDIFEMAAFNSVPSEGDRDTLVENMLAFYG